MGRYGTMFVNYARCKGTSTKISFTTISVKSVRVVHLLRADVEGKCDAIRWHPHCKFIGVKKGNGKMFFFFYGRNMAILDIFSRWGSLH